MRPILMVFMLGFLGCSAGKTDQPEGDAVILSDLTGLELKYDTNWYKESNESNDIESNESSNEGTTIVGFPSKELLIKITGPSGSGYATSPGGIVSIAGVVFGTPDKITWISPNGTGVAVGAPFWQTDGIILKEGDNLITVIAQKGSEQSTDTIVITYNPEFMFSGNLEVRPPALFVGETQKIYATIALGPFGSLVGSTLDLLEVQETGEMISSLGAMFDDGSNGDEIQKDGVYTRQVDFKCTTPGFVYLRAGAMVKGAFGKTYKALSAIAKIECVQRITPSACSSHQKTLIDAKQAYLNAISSSSGSPRESAIAVLKGDPNVKEVSNQADEDGLWVLWDDGVLGAINLGHPDVRGSQEDDQDWDSVSSAITVEDGSFQQIPILSRKTLLLSPFASEFGNDEIKFVQSIASVSECPYFNIKGTYVDAGANLSRFREWVDSGIFAIATHGETYFKTLSPQAKQRYGWKHLGSHEVLWTGEAINCGNLTQSVKTCTSASQCPQGTFCMITQATYTGGTMNASGICYDATQIDLATGRVVLGDKTYGVTPAFFLKYGLSHKAPQSLIYLGACKSLYNGSLASSFFASGAKSVIGYTNVVSNQFAIKQGSNFFAQMIEQKNTVGQAFGVGAQDPEHQGSFFSMFGARNLTVSFSDILNPSFETGDLTAWEKDGDARVITKLGIAGPTSGKFMGIISTGLGFTTQTGSIEQTFCIPQGKKTFSFFWKYYSEEFHEWCGSQYQDTFTASFTTKTGVNINVVNLAVDNLCAKNDCFGCGSHYVGLTPSDVQFDQGDNHKTDWQKATYNISSLAGTGPVTLKFFCTDKGDSIYDTAVLIDNIKFE